VLVPMSEKTIVQVIIAKKCRVSGCILSGRKTERDTWKRRYKRWLNGGSFSARGHARCG
jgi:hypothetical protein